MSVMKFSLYINETSIFYKNILYEKVGGIYIHVGVEGNSGVKLHEAGKQGLNDKK